MLAVVGASVGANVAVVGAWVLSAVGAVVAVVGAWVLSVVGAWVLAVVGVGVLSVVGACVAESSAEQAIHCPPQFCSHWFCVALQ